MSYLTRTSPLYMAIPQVNGILPARRGVKVRIVGAVNDPADAGRVDDASLPELPVVMASAPRGR